MTFRSSDPVRCAEAIFDRAGRDLALAIPIGIGKPVQLANALYRLAEADRSLRLRIFTGLTLVRPAYRTSLEQRFVELEEYGLDHDRHREQLFGRRQLWWVDSRNFSTD